jgi:hypothetical protein
MRRRQLLRASAAAVGGGAATAGLVSLAGDSEAQTALTLSIDGDEATLGPEGAIAAVPLDAEIEWAYELPDSASPSTVVVELAAGVDSVSPVASAQSAELFTSAEGSESFDVDLLGEAVDADELAPDSGATRETELTVEARLRVEDASGEALARETASDTATLTVTRERSASDYGEVGGSGSVTIETE